ncbi:MAG: nickel pincer cofactor biosynthesis protein LarC [Lentisphaeria bacterium]|nr:nickel pincer cofactor biosynthesis protein LarC [Lentisphaeria bacterium]
MGKILYLEGASGISGDMTVGALLDLGADRKKLDAVLKSLHLEGFDYAITRKSSYGIAGCDFEVILQHENHLHDHHHDHHGHHEHRNLSDVYAVIDRGTMTDRARELAKKIFLIVAEAESKAHGKPIDQVHFHEVGAIDSIVDIVSAAVLIDDLGITECVVADLTEGHGFVHCQHGDLPVPVPAVLNIASTYAIALRTSAVEGEMVTPTGIAIAAALRTRTELPERYTISKVGIGLGKRDFGHANMLRAMLLENAAGGESIYLLETNIDDATGEQLGLALEKLMSAGARDAHFLPCYMKKNRPAYLLRVITDSAHLKEMEQIIFESTTTIGLRKIPVVRTVMQRQDTVLHLPFGTVQAKTCSWNGITRCYPEYESVKKLAETTGMDFQTVFTAAKELAEKTT